MTLRALTLAFAVAFSAPTQAQTADEVLLLDMFDRCLRSVRTGGAPYRWHERRKAAEDDLERIGNYSLLNLQYSIVEDERFYTEHGEVPGSEDSRVAWCKFSIFYGELEDGLEVEPGIIARFTDHVATTGFRPSSDLEDALSFPNDAPGWSHEEDRIGVTVLGDQSETGPGEVVYVVRMSRKLK